MEAVKEVTVEGRAVTFGVPGVQSTLLVGLFGAAAAVLLMILLAAAALVAWALVRYLNWRAGIITIPMNRPPAVGGERRPRPSSRRPMAA